MTCISFSPLNLLRLLSSLSIYTSCPAAFFYLPCQSSYPYFTFNTLARGISMDIRSRLHYMTTWNIFCLFVFLILPICWQIHWWIGERRDSSQTGGFPGMNASKTFAEHFSLYSLAHLPFFRPCSADAIMSAHTHTVKISALSWPWLATLPACGLLDLLLCCHHLIAVLVQHGGMFMWLRNAKYVWNIFFKKKTFCKT